MNRAADVQRLVALATLLAGCSFEPAAVPQVCATEDRLVPRLRATPNEYRNMWLGDETETFPVLLSASDCSSLEGLSLLEAPDWLEIDLGEAMDFEVRVVQITVLTNSIPLDQPLEAVVRLGVLDSGIAPAEIPFYVWRVDLDEVHIGVGDNDCVRGTETLCDVSGLDALFGISPFPDVHIILYPSVDGGSSVFEGTVRPARNTWISAAPGVSPEEIIISSNDGGQTGAVILLEDHVRLQGITLITGNSLDHIINARSQVEFANTATVHHLIENVIGVSLTPESFAGNGVEEPLALGSFTTVRNSHFFGYWETGHLFEGADGLRIIGNTFVSYHDEDGPADIGGSRNLVFANNVMVILSAPAGVALLGDDGTRGAVITDNVFEGYAQATAGLNALDGANTVGGNVVGRAQAESPLYPRFLADSRQKFAGRTVGPEGLSLDGVELGDGQLRFPGAYQVPSERTGSRERNITVGNGTCGAETCDVDASVDNELQVAVWSVWPGNEVQVFPSDEPYAGNAVVSWGTRIVGMGDTPEDVVLENRGESPVLYDSALFRQRGSLIHVPQIVVDPVDVENLTLRVTDGLADGHALFYEGAGLNEDKPAATIGINRVRRVRVEGGVDQTSTAIVIGDNTVVQDVLVEGRFSGCVGAGPRNGIFDDIPETSVVVMNVTCRMLGVDPGDAAFWVAATDNSLFANIVVEFEPADAATVFRAQRIAGGNDDGAFALNQPSGLMLAGVTARGASALLEAILPESVSAQDEILLLTSNESLFQGQAPCDPSDAACELLVAGHTGNGVDPTDYVSDAVLGTSINGVDRNGVAAPDRGAFQQ